MKHDRDDLIARLKRLHKGATSSGIVFLSDTTVAEIIAALEECERMRAVVEAARYYRAEQESGDVHLDSSEALWQDLRAALVALEKSHDPLPG